VTFYKRFYLHNSVMDYHPKDLMYGFQVICIDTIVISIITVITNTITIVIINDTFNVP